MKMISLFTIVSMLLMGCEKDITITSPNAEPQLVVEATIENDAYPIVILSKSFDYFGKINPELLSQSFVSNAIVKVSNGTLTHTLKEYTIPVNSMYSVKVYTVDFSNLSTAFKGSLNSSYSLSISSAGKAYNATTTIPLITRRIDSLYYADVPLIADTNWKKLIVTAYDPPGLGDYIQYYTQRNSEPEFPGDPSAYDDAFIDGTTYTVEVARGKDRNNPRPDGEYSNYFKRGDTVTMKVSNIDKPTYDFWRTMEYTYQSIGNPFASPIKVLSNIKGAPALGYFGGYATQQRTIIIPR